MIRNSAYRNPSIVFFNSSSGTTILEAINIHHISIFGICEDVRHFSQHSNNFAINSHNSQQPTDSSHRFTCFRQWRSTAGGKGNTGRPNQTTTVYSQMPLSRKPFRMIDDMLIGPVILDDRVTGQNYLHLLQNERNVSNADIYRMS